MDSWSLKVDFNNIILDFHHKFYLDVLKYIYGFDVFCLSVFQDIYKCTKTYL